jgi:hypothetical protein
MTVPPANVDKIIDHTAAALRRLLQQYKGKINLQRVIEIYADQAQLLEDTTHGLFFDRTVDHAIGDQLDELGLIVDQPRLNNTDDRYRQLIKGKIGQNVSSGELDRIALVWKILSNATFTIGRNLRGGEIELFTDGVIAEADRDANLIQIQRSVAAGVRVDELIFFDEDEPFAFAGPNTTAPAEGFGTVADLAVGGKFAFLHRHQDEFAFAGVDLSPDGFGTLADPVLGGLMVGL